MIVFKCIVTERDLGFFVFVLPNQKFFKAYFYANSMVKGYRDSGLTALEYFNEHFGDEPITKTELRKKDTGLHDKLYRDGTLNEAISLSAAEINGYRDSGLTALEYFKQHYGDGPITKTELREEDMGLYDKLYNEGTLEDAISLSAAEINGYRSSGLTALEYFNEHFGDRLVTKTELREEDMGLHDKLYRDGTLDDAIS